MTEKLKRKTIYFLLLPLLAAAAAGYCFCLPRTLFDEPFSATVWSRDGPSDVGQGRFRRTVALFPYGQRALQIPCRYYYLRGQTFLPPFRGRSAGARPRRAAEPRFGKGGQRRQHAYDADDPPEPRPESEDPSGRKSSRRFWRPGWNSDTARRRYSPCTPPTPPSAAM